MDIANVRGSNEDELDNELEACEDLPPVTQSERDRFRIIERSFTQMQGVLEHLMNRAEDEENPTLREVSKFTPVYKKGDLRENRPRRSWQRKKGYQSNYPHEPPRQD